MSKVEKVFKHKIVKHLFSYGFDFKVFLSFKLLKLQNKVSLKLLLKYLPLETFLSKISEKNLFHLTYFDIMKISVMC